MLPISGVGVSELVLPTEFGGQWISLCACVLAAAAWLVPRFRADGTDVGSESGSYASLR